MNPPTPTLCLVMDGARIVSYEIAGIGTPPPERFYEMHGSGFTVKAIPLSLCAIAPEMREALGELVEFCDDPEGGSKPESLALGLARMLPRLRLLSSID